MFKERKKNWHTSLKSIARNRSESSHKQTERIDLFSEFCASKDENPNNLDYLNLKLDCPKEALPMMALKI